MADLAPEINDDIGPLISLLKPLHPCTYSTVVPGVTDGTQPEYVDGAVARCRYEIEATIALDPVPGSKLHHSMGHYLPYEPRLQLHGESRVNEAIRKQIDSVVQAGSGYCGDGRRAVCVPVFRK